MPSTYLCPSRAAVEPFTTTYQVFTGKGALFENGKGTKLADVTDGTSNTLMVVEAEAGRSLDQARRLAVRSGGGPVTFRRRFAHPGGFNALDGRWIGAVYQDSINLRRFPGPDHAQRGRGRSTRVRYSLKRKTLMDQAKVWSGTGRECVTRRIVVTISCVLAAVVLAMSPERAQGQDRQPAAAGAGVPATPLARYVPRARFVVLSGVRRAGRPRRRLARDRPRTSS